MHKKFLKSLSLLVAVAFILGATPLMGFVMPIISMASTEVHQHTRIHQGAPFVSENIAISNASFNEPEIATHTSTITSWTEERGSAAAVASIINTRDFINFRYENNIHNHPFMAHNPGNNNHDDNILALANRLPNGTANVGFKSSPFNFHADGYFMVSVDFYAVRGTSAVYLMPTAPLDDNIQTSIEIRQQSFSRDGVPAVNESMWTQATFFVRTDARQEMTFNLGLFLGTQTRATGGVVYYDNVQVSALSQGQFYTDLGRVQNDPLRSQFMLEIDLRQHDELGNIDEFTNSDNYALGITDFSSAFGAPFGSNMTHASTASVHTILNFEEPESVHSRFGSNPRNVMLLSSIDGRASMVMDYSFTIGRNSLYMISFYTLHNGNANIRLHETREDNTYVPVFDSGFISIQNTASTSSNFQNNWVLNTLFITGDPLFDKEVDIAFWMGTDTGTTTGWLLVDDFSIIRVSQDYFAINSESENTNVIRLFEPEPPTGIQNANFNVGAVRSANQPFPLIAANWGLDSGNADLAISGIVNTEPAHWARNSQNGNYGNAIRPDSVRAGQDPNNNVFMLQNLATNHQTLTSSSFSLHRGTYNIISFDLARYTTHSMVAYAIIQSSGTEIARIDLSSTTPILNPTWQTLSFGIRASEFTGHEVTISFILGEENNQSRAATIFINQVRLRQENAINNDNSIDGFADLSDPMSLTDVNGNSLFMQSNDYFDTDLTNDVLFIHSRGYTSGLITTTFAEELEAGSFYQYTVTARLNISGNRRLHNVGYDDDNRPYLITEPSDVDYGINMFIQDFDGGFFNMKPGDMSVMPSIDHTGFVTFTFFIRTESSASLNLVVEFGTVIDGLPWREVNGVVEIREISLRQIEEIEWNNARTTHRERINNDEASNYSIVTESAFIAPPEIGDNDGGVDFNLLYIPLIIMAVAIIFAVAAFLLRRTKFNRHIGKKHTSYKNDDLGVRGADEVKAKKVKPTNIKATPATPQVEE